MSDFSAAFNEISWLLQNGKVKEIAPAVEKALKDGACASDILEKALISGMNIIGAKFKKGEIFVPQVLVSARAMNLGAAALKPALIAAGVEPAGKAIVCTVKGDLHDIGKNLVKMMLEGCGIEVEDLGVNCSIERIIEAVRASDAKVLCLSALLTTTMTAQRDVIKALKEEGLRDKVMVMIGGAPVTKNFAKEISADAYTPDAATAAQVCLSFFQELSHKSNE